MKKVLALILCLALVLSVTLPGTLAVSAAEDSVTGDFAAEETSQPTETSTETGAPDESGSTETTTGETQPDTTDETGDTTGDTADGNGDSNGSTEATEAPAETDPTETTAPQCTCGREDGEHNEGCPLYSEEEEEEDSETETVTETTVVTYYGISDCAPGFTSAGPLIQYDTPALMSLFSTYATDDAGGSMTSGLELNKTATANEDGSFTITLDAYATGESVTTYVKDGVDIVLMLDLSNYMGKAVTREEETTSYTYTSVSSNTKLNSLSTNSNTYFYKDGEVYYPVTVTKSGYGYVTYTLKYTKNGTDYTIVSGKDGNTSLNRAGSNNGSVTLYTRTEKTDKTTTTTYDTSDLSKLNALKTAVNSFIDKVHTETPASRIAIVTYAGSASVRSGTQVATDGALVTANDEGVAALKEIVNGLSIAGGASNSHYAAADAVKIFQAVPTTSAEYNRQRVAILFSAGVPGTGWATENKAVLTTGNSIAQATMTQAYILKSDKGTTVTAPGGNVDGGAQWSAFSGTEIYNSTVYTGCGATFYSVGLDIPTSGDPSSVSMKEEPYKSGALANEYFWRSSSHRINGTHIFYGYSGSDNYVTAVRAAFGEAGVSVYNNRYNNTTYGSLYYFYPDILTRNQSNGYYLTTTSGSDEDLAKLNNIFSSIAGQIVIEGNSSTTLGTSTVIRDIMSPQFELPEGTEAKDITVKAYDFAGMKGTEYTFSTKESSTASGAKATVEDGTVSVTGFDFSANWCGTSNNQGNVTNHGSKLVISFTVVPKDGFLGGNNVYTNDLASGVYKDAYQESPLDIFPQPQVNVQIDDNIAQTPGTMNVYLTGNVSAEDIRNGCKAKCGEVELNLNPNVENFGLEDWQTEYVNISVTIEDAEGNILTDFNNLSEDTTYSITVTVSPKEEAKDTSAGEEATAKSNTETDKINVFKPELTFKDSTVYYGDTAPASYDGNLTNTQWKHGTTLDTNVTMIGTAPELTKTYTPEVGKIVDNKVATKSDIPVDVTVKIGTTDVTDKTTFVHTKCNVSESDPANGKFWLHVKTCSLTITKAAGADTTIGNDEYFVFTIKKDGEVYTQVTIRGTGSVTISELPVGIYTVVEDTSTAWRYTSTISGNGNLSSTNPTGSFTCTNTKSNNQWLNHFNRVINKLGQANPTPDNGNK